MKAPKRFGGLPTGGNSDNELIKNSATDFDTNWETKKKLTETVTISSPSTVWVCNHGLDFIPNSILITDSADSIIVTGKRVDTAGVTTLYFASGFSGKAKFSI